MGHVRNVIVAVCAPALLAAAAMSAEVLIEAESLDELGGWVIDQQFIDVMGSSYLLAHGLGRPCAAARGRVEVPHTGRYRAWVRTKDWIPEPQWAPGEFRVAIGGRLLDARFGTAGDGVWIWQDGGVLDLSAGPVEVELRDATGFDARCDAIYLTTDLSAAPPAAVGPDMARWRERLLGLPQPPPSAGRFDVVVIGGGIAGCSAALTAARLGCRVALVHDRPVFGGNNSPEIRVHTGPWGVPPRLVSPEIAGNFGHGTSDPKWWDPATSPVEAAERRRQRTLDAEKNIVQFAGWHMFRAQTHGDRIQSVDAVNIRSARQLRFAAPVFIDCTGDGWVGFWAGADFRHGQEARTEHNEPLAPLRGVKMTLGSTLMWCSRYGPKPADWPDVPWATAVSKDMAATHGDWRWEYGHYRDTVWEAEEIRDHLLRAIYGSFSTARRTGAAVNARLELAHVNYIAGKRESRRLLGDYILTQRDCWDDRDKPDKAAEGDNPFDLHVPGSRWDFIVNVHPDISLKDRRRFDIPLRCLYSRNVGNLLMAGRCISATRVAHSAIRIQNTGGQTGVAAGAAAFLCTRYDTTPRGVYERHLTEFQDIVFDRGRWKGALSPRDGRPATRAGM